MSKYHVGDTFKIEVAEVFQGAESRNYKYRIKGFDNLVFDEKGLGRLEPIKVNTGVAKEKYWFGDLIEIDSSLYIILDNVDDYITAVREDTRTIVGDYTMNRDVRFLGHINESIVVEFLNGIRSWERTYLEARR